MFIQPRKHHSLIKMYISWVKERWLIDWCVFYVVSTISAMLQNDSYSDCSLMCLKRISTEKQEKKHRSLGRFHSLVWTFASRQHGYLKKSLKHSLQCLITLTGKCSNGICALFQVPGHVKPIKNTKPDVLNVWNA